LDTGNKYVGSSSKLAKRLQGYFNGTHKSVGKFIPFLKLEGLSKFKLEILLLSESYFVNKELALEQYFLLHPEFNLNTLKVVNSFSGARAKSLYMYSKDFSKLILEEQNLKEKETMERIQNNLFAYYANQQNVKNNIDLSVDKDSPMS
jgi:hypothetical protein